MKTNIILLIFLSLLTANLLAQGQWEWLNPTPTGNAGNDIHFISSDTGFIVTDIEILQTTNGGINWNIQAEIASSNDINFFNKIGYIVGKQGYVLKTMNGGQDWVQIDPGVNFDLNSVHLITEDTILISSSNSLIKSFDGGQQWQISLIPNHKVVRTFFISTQVGHAACEFGTILKTIDGGENWYVTESVSFYPSDFFSIHFVNEDLGFASREHDELLKTIDGGESWESVDAYLDAAFSIFFVNDSTGYIAGEDGAIHKTSDGGDSWDWVGFDGRKGENDLNAVYFLDDSVGFCASLKGRIIKTIDGGANWREYASTHRHINQITFTTNTNAYFLAEKAYSTRNGGYEWDTLTTSEYLYNDPSFSFKTGHFFSTDSFFLVADNGRMSIILKTSDAGESFEKIDSYDHFNRVSALFFLDPSIGFVSKYDGSYSNGIYKTIDGGANWELISPQIRLEQIYFSDVNTGFGIRGGYLYQSTDGGITWEKTFEVDGDLNDMHFVNPQLAYIAADHRTVLKTIDGGTSWVELSTQFDHLLSVCFMNENVGFVAGQYGTFHRTFNGGLTWTRENIPGRMLSLHISDDKHLYAAGYNGALLKDSLIYNEVHCLVNPVMDYSSNKALLSGIVASNAGTISSISFEFGLEQLFDKSISAAPGVITSNSADSVLAQITDLQPDKEYFYRLKVSHNNTVHYSEQSSFHTLPEYELINFDAFPVNPNDARLSGEVIASEDAVSEIEFEYGTDTVFGMSVEALPNSVAAGTKSFIEANPQQLDPKTLYYYRIKAMYKGNLIYSRTRSFTTISECDFTMAWPRIEGNNALIGAYVTPRKDSLTDIVFEYGTTRDYENEVAASPDHILQNYTGYLELQLTDLDSSSLYFYRIRGKFGADTIYSGENLLDLQEDIVILPIEAEQLSDSSILLQGLINTFGENVHDIQFQYGLSGDFGDSVFTSPGYVFQNTTYLVSSVLSGLMPDTLYHFRLIASSGEDILYSESFTFRLSAKTIVGLPLIAPEILLYPNPAKDHILLKSASPIEAVEILDLNGRTCLNVQHKNRIELPGFLPGVYFVKIKSADREVVRKLVLQH